MAWMGSEESRMEIVGSTREWAAVCLRVRDEDDGGGLDEVRRRLVRAATAVDPLRLPNLKRTARRVTDRSDER